MCEAAPRLLWIRKVAEDVLSSGRCVTQVTVYYITQSTLPGCTGSTGTKCRRRKRQKTQLKTKNTPPAMYKILKMK